ncbi:MAG: 4-alpha-glucanotransferase [Thermoleophilia bacterium]|nr:4-alpha-glucanotransferase [Thermoleophilia bacterium]
MPMVAQSRNYRSARFDKLLAEAALLWGLQTDYRDWKGNVQTASAGALTDVLRALGVDLGGSPGAGEGMEAGGDPKGEQRLRRAVELRKKQLNDRLVEPVLVAWDGVLPASASQPAGVHHAGFSGPAGRTDEQRPVRLTLVLEGGSEDRRETTWGGMWRGRLWPECLPFGYHRMLVEVGSQTAEAHVISAPRRCWRPGDAAPPGAAAARSEPAGSALGREWGLFAPLYGLRSERDRGAGDLAELQWLQERVDACGGGAVATLPLLASFLDRPFEPSPYRPVSRLFWNEFYLAVERIAEWGDCAEAHRQGGEAALQEEVGRLRAVGRVDYAGVMRVKRRLLEALCRCFFDRAGSERREAFVLFVRTQPEALAYASFRARVERGDSGGPAAPDATWAALSGLGERERYHLYCQWQMEEQLSRLSGLFLDLPVGVHPQGFDVDRWPDLFAPEMSVGAPPDSYFPWGQDWTSPPLDPQKAREQGHAYFARCLRHHMRHASYLRVDHVMSLHRLYWVPQGREPTDGVYVTYPAEELYAVLALESHRHGVRAAGEDLGMVPRGVRAAMRRHGLLGTWVLQGALKPRARRVIEPPPRHAVAYLGTHDMFPLAGFFRGDDIAAREMRGGLDEAEARRLRAARLRLIARLTEFLTHETGTQVTESPADILRALLLYLGASPAAMVVVNLNDLLLETEPQNVPGTAGADANWTKKVAVAGAVVEGAIADAAARLGTTGRR